MWTLLVAAAAILLTSDRASAKVYERCDFAKFLLQHLHKSVISSISCIAKEGANLDTRAVTTDKSGKKNYGIFQINEEYCGSGSLCGLQCSKLQDNVVQDDLACMKKVYSKMGKFSAFSPWRETCTNKDVSTYIKGCKFSGSLT